MPILWRPLVSSVMEHSATDNYLKNVQSRRLRESDSSSSDSLSTANQRRTEVRIPPAKDREGEDRSTNDDSLDSLSTSVISEQSLASNEEVKEGTTSTTSDADRMMLNLLKTIKKRRGGSMHRMYSDTRSLSLSSTGSAEVPSDPLTSPRSSASERGRKRVDSESSVSTNSDVFQAADAKLLFVPRRR